MAKYYRPKSIDDMVHYDMHRKPQRQWRILSVVTWLGSFIPFWLAGGKVKRTNMEGLKPPYLLLGNHNAFTDFQDATVGIFPHRANYIVSIDVYPALGWVLEPLGGIATRKFTTDTTLVKSMMRCIKNGDIVIMYPEARYSFAGTPCVLPPSVGKLAKLLKVPVVTLVAHGNHIGQPLWNLRQRGWKKPQFEIKQLLTAEQVKEYSVDDINQALRDEFDYNDYEWQLQHKIKCTKKWRAEGLHKILYQCPHCKTEFEMSSKGHELTCNACGKVWDMSIYGQLKAVRIGDTDLSGDESATEFTKIPDWFEWERSNVHEEVMSGRYCSKGRVRVDDCPSKKGYVRMGEGDFVHDYTGFHVNFSGPYGDFEFHNEVADNFTCHIEYNFHKTGLDAISLSSLTDTYFLYSLTKELCPAKVYFATEELYFNYFKHAGTINGKPISPHVRDNMTHPKTEFGF